MLVDARGPFGNPTSDSLRTCITEATRSALVVGYAPAGYSTARLTRSSRPESLLRARRLEDEGCWTPGTEDMHLVATSLPAARAPCRRVIGA